IGEVELDELEVLASAEDLEPSVLQRDVVVLIEVVETDHLVAALEQYPRRMKTNESGGACNEDSQTGLLPTTDQSRPLDASFGNTCLMSKITVFGLPKLRMPLAPSSTYSLCATATTIAS